MSNKEFSDRLNQFTLKLFSSSASTNEENHVISPLSVSLALQMCMIGSKDSTQSELTDLLCLNDLSSSFDLLQANKSFIDRVNQHLNKSGISINIANRLYVMKSFRLRDDYKQMLTKYFDASIESVDFRKSEKVAKQINDWIERKTNSKIKDMVDADMLNELTRFVLLNAIYFKGNWLTKFDERCTRKLKFTQIDGKLADVDMMILYAQNLKLQSSPCSSPCITCELPYVGKELSMTIILPNVDIQFHEFERSLNMKLLSEIVNSKKKSLRLANLYLPKFKIESTIDVKFFFFLISNLILIYFNLFFLKIKKLNDMLMNLGCRSAFSPSDADFSGIGDRDPNFENVFISKVLQKAFIEVNEEGTEAAAVTMVTAKGCSATSSGPTPIEFKCDRPFLFVLHETATNCIFFIGKYLKA